MSEVRFLPWLRQGLGAERRTAGAISVAMKVENVATSVPIKLYGPADVAGVEPRQFVRSEPQAGAIGFRPNWLPYVELRRPDLPWMMSRAVADTQGRLRPWLCLIVVDADLVAPPQRLGAAPLPRLLVPGAQLPALADAHLWAHVQLQAEPGDDLQAVIRSHPERAVARLLSGRRLEPNRRYLACVVPTTEAGRLAGLGQLPTDPTVDLDALGDQVAWTASASSVELPVYHHWTFATGEPGDFESAARQIRPYSSAGMAPWAMTVESLAPGAEPREIGLPSPLYGTAPSWTGASYSAARTRLQQWITDATAGNRPKLGPPVYGTQQVLMGTTDNADRSPGLPATQPSWVHDLNLDARYRAAAGLGVELVRIHQQELVEEASRQAGAVVHANRMISGAAFAATVGQRVLDKHITAAPAGLALAALAPALKSATIAGRSAALTVAESRVGADVTSPAFRRMLHGRLRVRGLAAAVARRNDTPFAPRTPPAPDKASTTSAAVADLQVELDAARLATRSGDAAARASATSSVGALEQALKALAPRAAPTRTVAAPRALALATTVETIGNTLAPRVAAPRRMAACLQTSLTPTRLLELRRISVAPELATPLGGWLHQLDPRLLVPGAGDQPTETVSGLGVCNEFIEALMVGANHELGRELAWRGIPVDPGATFLRRFWPRTGTAAQASGYDIKPLADWPLAARLGSAGSVAGQRPETMIVLRSELVRRFPDALFYVAKCVGTGTGRKPSDAAADHKVPLFRGPMPPDALYLAFADTEDELRTGNSGRGWYFVIQERPGAPRFGFDQEPAPSAATWMDLSWSRVPVSAGHVAPSPPPAPPSSSQSLIWARNAAHMAAIARRRPALIAIHCAQLLP